MSELDLTEAIEAVARAYCVTKFPYTPSAYPDDEARERHIAYDVSGTVDEDWLIAAVRAAAPIIERAVRERLGGICGDQAPRMVFVDGGEDSGAGVICELHHGHPSQWHEALNEFGPPMRWRPASVTISGTFGEAK